MDPAHRFSTPEIEEVFARAATAQRRAEHEADLGLTLAELQEAAAEAGLDPIQVAAAARAVASGEPDDKRETLAGIPVGVRRAATVDAPPSEALWDTLVADLQDTFSARGKTERIGASRIWRNGHLRATLSPSGDGARLRLQSNRRDNTRGALLMSLAQAVIALSIFFGQASDLGAFVLAVFAVGLAAGTVGRQVSWSRTRERQMEAVAARAQRTARAVAADASPQAAVEPVRLDLLDLDAMDDPDRPRDGRPARRTRG